MEDLLEKEVVVDWRIGEVPCDMVGWPDQHVEFGVEIRVPGVSSRLTLAGSVSSWSNSC